LLQVTARYLPSTGGTELHTYEVARRLAAAGQQVTVLTTDPEGRLPPREQADGVAVRRVRAWPARRDYFLAPGIWGEIHRGRWDLVHVQGYHTLVAPLAMLAAHRARIPYVVTFHSGGHSSRVRQRLRRAQWAALRPLLLRASRLIAVSRFEAQLFASHLRLPRERIPVIKNGASLPAPEDADGATAAGPLIVSVGRLEEYKGHHRVISALPDVLRQEPDARLRIVGQGPYEPALRRLSAALGVADRVTIGPVPAGDRQAMAALLRAAALVTLLSDYESFGIAPVEALAVGTPVLVADATGLHDLVEDGLAAGVPLDSRPPAIAQAIVAQLRAARAPARVPPPSWDACARAVLDVYTQVLGERPAAAPAGAE
jgi:glycosyltransferase involved in cell wall biosynthesis